MKVDVVVLTKNSERTLRKCLSSIYNYVPVNRLIVVDGFSTDKTLKIIRKFNKKHHNVVLLSEKGTRGKGRQKAIEAVTTEWFVFVDSDVILCKGWFKKAKRLIKADVGAIWGIEVWSVLKNITVLKLFERVTLKIFGKRGGTHDLLVRREAVKDIHIPSNLHVYEDAYIKSWICKKGYKVVSAYEPYCIHYRPPIVWTIKKSIFFVSNELKFAIRYPQLLLSYALYAVIVLYQNMLRNIRAKS
ncbi:MAG: glycosyltransferase family 2 protein [Candidatus Bathyarchaeota archaeon]|nr:glycosyltransferase family 2 protein [Candidatus Bathyarchaeota archaeon]MDH5494317.1 glycosyltransferase family 2 protein [Candidatus Bathyarchaeota archaeon]